MRLLRLFLQFVLIVLAFNAFYLYLQSAGAQPNELLPIYTNSAPEQIAWSADSAKLVFLGSASERGVELSQPNWLQYDSATTVLSQSIKWPLQPTLTAAEIETFDPLMEGVLSFMFVSPNGRFIVYTTSGYELAIADRQVERFYLIPDVHIPNSALGPDQFNVLWGADSTAFTVMYAPAYGEDFGTIYVRGFTSEPVALTKVHLSLPIDGRGFRGLIIQDVSADRTQVILTGSEITPNSDVQDPRTKLILINIDNPEASQVLDDLSGTVQGASFAPDTENKLLVVNEQGLLEYDWTTGEVTVLSTDINATWVSRAMFSPDGQWVALIYDNFNEGNRSIYVVRLADLVPLTPTPTYTPTDTSTSTFTPSYTPTATNTATHTPADTATETYTSTPSATPTATYTPTFTPTPSVVCTATVAAGNALELVNAINAANGNGNSADTICLENSTYTLTAVDNTTDGANGLPSITSDITIVGNGATLTRDTAAPAFRLFHVAANGSLTLENLTVSGGSVSGDGGAIYNLGTLTLIDSTIINSSTSSDGGAIYSEGTLVLSGASSISNNTAGDDGG